jgi:hypothetical protein
MPDLRLTIEGAAVAQYAAAPQLAFKVRIANHPEITLRVNKHGSLTFLANRIVGAKHCEICCGLTPTW